MKPLLGVFPDWELLKALSGDNSEPANTSPYTTPHLHSSRPGWRNTYYGPADDAKVGMSWDMTTDQAISGKKTYISNMKDRGGEGIDGEVKTALLENVFEALKSLEPASGTL